MTCLMVFLVVLSTSFLRRYVFDTHERVRCRNYHRGTCQRWKIPPRNHSMENWLFHLLARKKVVKNRFLCHFDDIIHLLIAKVTYGEPTRSIYCMHDVGTPNGAVLVNKWQMYGKTRYSSPVGFLLPFVFAASKKSLRFFWGLILWMLSIGRARHPGPCIPSNPSGFSIEFLNVGGWLSSGDLALESKAHFLAVAEHRLVRARARNVTTQLCRARRSSVWAPSCQDFSPGGHAGVGVISLHGAPLSLPTLFDPSFKEFFRMGRAMRVALPLGNGGIAHLFVILWLSRCRKRPGKTHSD